MKNKLFQKIKIICSILFVIFCILLVGCNRQTHKANSYEGGFYSENTEYEIRYDIKLKNLKKIKIGMWPDEVREILGTPHDNSGKKYLGDVYYLADGSEAAIIYDNYGVFRIIHEKNGKRVILLEK